MDLRALRELAEAATPGPWGMTDKDHAAPDECEECGCSKSLPTVHAVPEGKPYMLHICRMSWADRGEADAAFIAAANPQAILDIIGRVEALQSALADVMRYDHAPRLTGGIGAVDCMCRVHEDARKLLSQKG